jgi:hypothetical protein
VRENIDFESVRVCLSHPDRNCDITTAACFYFKGGDGVQTAGTNLAGASISVNVLRDRRTEQDCDNIERAFPP